MAEARSAAAGPPSLFRQIAVRLAVLTLVFALLDVAIVVPMYAFDQQALAEDFVEQQAHRIARGLSQSHRAAAPNRVDMAKGLADWGYVVIDRAMRPAARLNDTVTPDSPLWPTPATLDWTRRERSATGVLITGVRRFDGPGGPHWILIRADAVGSRAFWPVIGQELLAHVALPLAPLTVLLLIFSVQVVGRTLAPLERAAAEVDGLDPARMDARLTPPTASREIAALVMAVNRALDRLQRAMSILRTFTADAAHELRTPLAVLRLRTGALPDSEIKARLDEDIQAMTRLVNQLLDLAQADALRMEGVEEIDLATLAREVVSQIAPHAFAQGQDIRLTDLGGAAVTGLPDALGRALRNLIENAIHHGGSTAPIEVMVGPGPRLSVRDHGPGLPAADSDKLFDRFWRKARHRTGGAGLGLGIVRSIVEAHGGAVSAQNAEDGGALFICDFPGAGGEPKSFPEHNRP
jgi:two-component system OmpR family sensor kinase